ncbi:hypothetical protein SCP_0505040 [Sparassis crispa]|uniref:Uncharacterized protein n=1 Tax=Sparassis crispa TaxID=139825 RepID=A0A401GML6_9APHY|nr:hypothetical protein SCP_0505040 [Sparassis crispa]GBE83455.1 hypothetical protein SCP_0505040 [Sparassis crispa]
MSNHSATALTASDLNEEDIQVHLENLAEGEVYVERHPSSERVAQVFRSLEDVSQTRSLRALLTPSSFKTRLKFERTELFVRADAMDPDINARQRADTTTPSHLMEVSFATPSSRHCICGT